MGTSEWLKPLGLDRQRRLVFVGLFRVVVLGRGVAALACDVVGGRKRLGAAGSLDASARRGGLVTMVRGLAMVVGTGCLVFGLAGDRSGALARR